MKSWPERAGCRMVARLVCKGHSGDCSLGEVWRSNILAAVNYRRPPPDHLIERVHRPDWDRSKLNLSSQMTLAVGYRRDGKPWGKVVDAAEFGVDLDAPWESVPADSWAAFQLAREGAAHPDGVELRCPKHGTRLFLNAANIVTMASRPSTERVPLPVESVL